ncbi:PIN domain-containing protein [Kordiimonas sp.]|uniref:PIN domain-containing protein n=1 Tax=Kordiimonas sp. TaxID=1970157 RepID=UPI003B522F6D
MIAIDTNVLLRYLLQDDDVQAVKASKLLSGPDRVLVTDVVLVETLWTLRGKKYKLQKDELVDVILALFMEPMVRFENGQVVWKALNAYREAKPIKGKEPDFADALIVCKAQYTVAAEDEVFGGSYTFDVAAQALEGAKKP